MNINEKIGKRIIDIRKSQKLTAEKLAWSADLSKSCISYAEKGNYDIKLSTIYSICKAFNMSLAEFFKTFDKI